NDGPQFSPNGKWIALVLNGLLHVLPCDNAGKPTGAPVQITHHATDSISWSGDSNSLLYLNNGKLRMVSRDGATNRRVPLDLTYSTAEGPSRQIIHAGKFWDGTSEKVQENVDIEIAFNRVKSVRPHSARGTRGANVIDATDQFVMP